MSETAERLLRRLSSAAQEMIVGVSVHNRMSKDCPGRMQDIEGPVVSNLHNAQHEARLWLESVPAPTSGEAAPGEAKESDAEFVERMAAEREITDEKVDRALTAYADARELFISSSHRPECLRAMRAALLTAYAIDRPVSADGPEIVSPCSPEAAHRILSSEHIARVPASEKAVHEFAKGLAPDLRNTSVPAGPAAGGCRDALVAASDLFGKPASRDVRADIVEHALRGLYFADKPAAPSTMFDPISDELVDLVWRALPRFIEKRHFVKADVRHILERAADKGSER